MVNINHLAWPKAPGKERQSYLADYSKGVRVITQEPTKSQTFLWNVQGLSQYFTAKGTKNVLLPLRVFVPHRSSVQYFHANLHYPHLRKHCNLHYLPSRSKFMACMGEPRSYSQSLERLCSLRKEALASVRRETYRERGPYLIYV